MRHQTARTFDTGDRVIWTDPDGGGIRVGTIHGHQHHGDNTVVWLMVALGGGEIEALPHELRHASELAVQLENGENTTPDLHLEKKQ